MPIRVLIADDHRLVRDGLRRSITGHGMIVVGEATDGDEAFRMAQELLPDVVLMDVTMPNCDGVEATRLIKEVLPDLPIVILTMHTDKEVRADAKDVGADKYLVKDCSSVEIIDAINEVTGFDPSARSTSLSPRESEVLQMLADGYSASEVAKRLYISERTIKNHLASCYEKLGASDRTQAVVKAIQSGVIVVSSPPPDGQEGG